MLISDIRLQDFPVLSLHVGAPVARIVAPIIDPDSLKVIAYRVDGPLVGRDDVGEILPVASVREFSSLGLVIDSTDEFVEVDDIVRVREVLKLNFELVGLKVVTKKGTKLGKVGGYTIDADSGTIMQLIVRRPAMKALIDPELTISRSQIIEVDDYQVVVKSEEAKIRQATQKDFVPSFVNPFREPNFAKEPATSSKLKKS